MEIIDTPIEGTFILEPSVHKDGRGFFLESYHIHKFEELGIYTTFVQDNLSFSCKNTIRGLHYQHPKGQTKLVQVIVGEVYDVAVDIRKGSPSFGKWAGTKLSGDNHRLFYIPKGFAHGFAVLSEFALFSYKCSDIYSPANEGGILWNDPELGIDWKVECPLLSEKDQAYPPLSKIVTKSLPIH